MKTILADATGKLSAKKKALHDLQAKTEMSQIALARCQPGIKRLEKALKSFVDVKPYKSVHFSSQKYEKTKATSTTTCNTVSIYSLKTPFTGYNGRTGREQTCEHTFHDKVGEVQGEVKKEFNPSNFPHHRHLLKTIESYIGASKDLKNQSDDKAWWKSGGGAVVNTFKEYLPKCSLALKIEQRNESQDDDSGYGGKETSLTSFRVGSTVLVCIKEYSRLSC